MPAFLTICLTLFLSACQSSPEVVTRSLPVLPPESYLQPCPLEYPDNRISTALDVLAAGIDCERADKAALRAWRAKHATVGDS